MDGMVEKDVIWQLMDLDPWDRLAGLGAFPHQPLFTRRLSHAGDELSGLCRMLFVRGHVYGEEFQRGIAHSVILAQIGVELLGVAADHTFAG